MISQYAPLALTPAAAFGAGVLGILILLVRGKHRDQSGVRPERFGVAFTLGFGIYSVAVLVVSNFFDLITLADAVKRVGNDRVSILFAAILVDLFGRFFRLVA